MCVYRSHHGTSLCCQWKKCFRNTPSRSECISPEEESMAQEQEKNQSDQSKAQEPQEQHDQASNQEQNKKEEQHTNQEQASQSAENKTQEQPGSDQKEQQQGEQKQQPQQEQQGGQEQQPQQEQQKGEPKVLDMSLNQLLDLMKRSNIINMDTPLKSLLAKGQITVPKEWGLLLSSGHWLLIWRRKGL